MKIEDIDRASMVVPPSPRQWVIDGPESVRYGWDENYIKKHGQKFSPWAFAKNCAAVLGHARANGKSELMTKMAEVIMAVAQPHIESIGHERYVVNRFDYSYLWHKMKPPFYGAFMNNVTASGLLHLYEATGAGKYLLLADRLMMTSVDTRATIPLCSDDGDGDFWLHEYVFRTDGDGSAWAEINSTTTWKQARIYNGHIHALLPLMRIREMTGLPDYDRAIKKAVATMRKWLPAQIHEGRYFSYSPDMPVFPDYGQKRALHLAESLGQLTGDVGIAEAAAAAKALWVSIEGREKEVIAAAADDAKRQYLASQKK
ncbi:D-glucuronyl C5-epimerase family protein [Cupriavidus alkaliphilus]|uniref:D-glucuronyl C5-epimerase C-terminal domain-containing protein n=1 Tax=Cupriavidus alkaliphilus TaxID=942866 RepID=A0A7W4YTX0_9BURK|nr:D-glucuronyl C5-epimerase family protein [Cupriavidus alkaliphilus]MBB3010634.1 hypothetical protein [Cupriavidus alkaliphilus]